MNTQFQIRTKRFQIQALYKIINFRRCNNFGAPSCRRELGGRAARAARGHFPYRLRGPQPFGTAAYEQVIISCAITDLIILSFLSFFYLGRCTSGTISSSFANRQPAIACLCRFSYKYVPHIFQLRVSVIGNSL